MDELLTATQSKQDATSEGATLVAIGPNGETLRAVAKLDGGDDRRDRRLAARSGREKEREREKKKGMGGGWEEEREFFFMQIETIRVGKKTCRVGESSV